VIVLDTHAWVWWISSAEQLSARAHKAITAAAEEGSACISSMSAWEVAMLVTRGRLELTMDVADWIAKSESLPGLTFIPVDTRIAVRSVLLPKSVSPDPVDRIIVATAIELGTKLITKDRRLRRFEGVATVW
jgi:PIN domain nuclease of toxin-antitoxin system